MRVGLGLYQNMLTQDNFRFAKQAGASHIVAHVGSSKDAPRRAPLEDAPRTWGFGGDASGVWSYEALRELREAVNAEGLGLAAIENFHPLLWHDVLLDGPRKRDQLENLKLTIRNVGRAGIPCIGYNFSIAGVWGHVAGEYARGGAVSVAYLGKHGPQETPIRNGEVWNTTYDPDAAEGTIGGVTEEQVWQRLEEFLRECIPVAEEAGVRLAAHPDDPPVPALRGAARAIYQPHHYQRLLDIVPSYYNSLEFCQGTTAEMSEGDVYEAIDRYSKQGSIAYVHFRNVRGKVPSYHEVFLDEGDVDVFRALRIYKKNGFDGVFIPDHTPRMNCDGPWHAGMAYALGYMRAAVHAISAEKTTS
ncbi:MAG: mannonate dehydratase [Chloroflexota bacterium]|nr:mannonate dehydratase [Chloroflexota bacterium]